MLTSPSLLFAYLALLSPVKLAGVRGHTPFLRWKDGGWIERKMRRTWEGERDGRREGGREIDPR